MSRVKGKDVTNYVVVPHKPIRAALARITAFGLAVALIAGAYYYGQRIGVGEEGQLLSERNELRRDLAQALSREDTLRQRVAVLENAAFVDRGAVDEVRQTNRELSDKIAKLEEDVALYQGIMSPSINAAGLTIQEVSLASTPSNNRYRFKVMLTQVGNNTNYLRGFVGINVLGVQNGEITAYPLSELSSDVDDVDIKFRYRYFQDFDGELVLPEAFTPDQIQVIAQSVGDNSARIERSYNWSDLENGNNVGQ